MDVFNFLMVLNSIIIGLGLAELLAHFSDVMRDFKRLNGKFLSINLIVLLILAFLQKWWESWALHVLKEWSFIELLLMLSGPVGFYLLSNTLCVGQKACDCDDLEVDYFQNSRKAWVIATITVLLSTWFYNLVQSVPVIAKENIQNMVVIIICLTLATSKNRILHLVTIPSLIVLILVDVVYLRPTIS